MKRSDAEKLYRYGYAVEAAMPGGLAPAVLRADAAGSTLPLPEGGFGAAVAATGRQPRGYAPADPRTVLHFQFADGSNPFVCYGSPEEILDQLENWGRNYEIACKKHDGRILYAMLSEKKRSESARAGR